tara:strand:+ start:35 stop:286 length:252 start_codon:yes stop_codon:yes gene_type:complete
MGTASMFGNQVMEAELDCDWMTTDVFIEFINHGSEEGNLVEIVSVKSHGVDITTWVNMDYIFDLVGDYIAEADYHWTDHGDAA